MNEIYYEVLITRVLHTARISNVDSVMFLIEIVEMVSFELDEELRKMFFLVHYPGRGPNFRFLFSYFVLLPLLRNFE